MGRNLEVVYLVSRGMSMSAAGGGEGRSVWVGLGGGMCAFGGVWGW